MAKPPSLRAALDAEQIRIDLDGFGLLCCYKDTRAGRYPTLLLHSVNAAPSAFEVRPLFEALRGRCDVYALELPGFGRSDRPKTVYDKALFTSAIRRAIEHLGIAGADIVAMSLSAEFACAVANQHPELVGSVALVSPTGFGYRSPPAAIGAGVFSLSRLPLLGKSLFSAFSSRPSIRMFLSQSFFGKVPVEMIEYAYETSHQPGAHRAPFYFLSFSLFTSDAFERLYKTLTQPALVLYDEDPNVEFDRLDDLLASRGNWSAVRISPTRGLPHWEQLESTTDALNAFWRRPA